MSTLSTSTQELIFAFENTHQTIAAEQVLLEAHFPVKVMPTPSVIAAGCGLCLRLPIDCRKAAHALLKSRFVRIQQIFILENGIFTCCYCWEKPLFSELLCLHKGDVVAIVGCGGKTSLLHRLAQENVDQKVLLSTTTHIYRPELNLAMHEVDLSRDKPAQTLPSSGICLLHGGQVNGKLTGITQSALESVLPNFDLTLLECDGSRQLPLKGWKDSEPVVPDETTVTVGVCTLCPVGLPASPALIHRPELFSAMTGAVMGETVTLIQIAAMISHSDGLFGKAKGRRILFINQVESSTTMANLNRLVQLLPAEFRGTLDCIIAASLQENYGEKLEEQHATD